MTTDPLEARPATRLATHSEPAARHEGFPAAPVSTASSGYRFTRCTWPAATGTPVASGPRGHRLPAAPGQEGTGINRRTGHREQRALESAGGRW